MIEVCKHITTSKYFIYISETSAGKALFVTPDARIISLDISLFSEIEEHDEEYLKSNHLVEPSQLQKLTEYQSNRSEETIENAKDLYDEMTESQKKIFIALLKGE